MTTKEIYIDMYNQTVADLKTTDFPYKLIMGEPGNGGAY